MESRVKRHARETVPQQGINILGGTMQTLDHWPEPNKAKRESTYSHLAGEYFVAAELSKRKYSVALTLGNAKAIDLFAEKELRTVNVQVKAISLRKNVGWPMLKAKVF